MAVFATRQVREAVSTPAGEWLTAPAKLRTAEHEAHIWKVDLSCASSASCDSVLSPEETKRAARFHFETDRRRFKIAHGSLREVLARYLNLPAAELTFGQTHYGKPFLVNPEALGLLFNMSHSEDLAVIAVAREREVGIDVEFMRADFATNEVAEHFFSVAELYTLSGLDPHQRTRAFFDCWTRKEAYVKARGEGLSMPLDVFDVSLAPDSPAALLRNRKDESETSRWILSDIELPADYVGALAIEVKPSPLRIRRFAFRN
ncbi:MAG TPA: 4'-phosphopantetheinyl transferase superfamily protein [Pyrinomonadaceae bacterium]|jgi:4'-phosphopantetheinyl transferase|nr:4'-phosphopantetheinyl transferase superfamily protein [Pyrinomonadaceae bacterium]